MQTQSRLWFRVRTIVLPLVVIAAVCVVVAWAAHSPVDWRATTPPLARRTGGPIESVQPPTDIRDAVQSVNAFFDESWRESGQIPAAPASDLQVLRRLSLALCGTIPSLEEIRQFEADPAADRLDRWTVGALNTSRFADNFAERLARSFVGTESGQFVVFRRDRFVDWLRQQLIQNRPYDEVVRKIVSETGLWTDHPASNFITAALDNGKLDENKLAGRSVRAFLGQRIDCAQCHDHPFAEWKQGQFQGLAALFGQTKVSLVGVEDKGHLNYTAEDRKTRKKRVIEPAVPFHPEWMPPSGTRRQRLAAWITHPQNRRFERATANRVWGLLFGKPYHSPVDDLPDPTVGGQDDVLDRLGSDFRSHHCDLRRLVRVIAASRPFTVDSIPKGADAGPSNAPSGSASSDDPAGWAVFPMTRLRPEQLVGSILQASSLRTIDQNSHLLVRAQRYIEGNEFVKDYGDLGENELEERAGTVSQALLRLNGKIASDALRAEPFGATSRISTFAASNEACIETCCLVAFTRRPTQAEADYFLPQLAAATKQTRSEVVEDLVWSLCNSAEFSWNH